MNYFLSQIFSSRIIKFPSKMHALQNVWGTTRQNERKTVKHCFWDEISIKIALIIKVK